MRGCVSNRPGENLSWLGVGTVRLAPRTRFSALFAIAGLLPLLLAAANLAGELEAVTRTLEQQVAERTGALTRKADQLRAVGQVGQQVAAVLDPGPLLHFVARVARGTFGFDVAAVLLCRENHLVLVACAARGQGRRSHRQSGLFSSDQSG